MSLYAMDERCVWMAAGLVAYKLCDRDHDCNTCPFDRAMRGESADQVTEEPFFSLDFGKFYHPKHLWVKIDGPGKITVGIDRFLAALVPKIKAVVLPKTGDMFLKDETFCHIIEERGIAPLPSPISGTILSTNSLLRSKPQLLIQDPEKDGYLLKMKPENVEKDIKNLYSGKGAISWLKKEEKKLIELLSSFSEYPTLGETMHDGGVFSPSTIGAVNEKDYQVIIETFFGRS